MRRRHGYHTMKSCTRATDTGMEFVIAFAMFAAPLAQLRNGEQTSLRPAVRNCTHSVYVVMTTLLSVHIENDYAVHGADT